ncbi:TonB-dependent receptor, partial [Escherichia coli]|nr:TonB-dependent receptor [Escherichia coli]
NLNITADGYWIKVKNRIVLTDLFSKFKGANLTPEQQEVNNTMNALGVDGAQFFANAIDTETRGVDVVISHTYRTGGFSLKND